METPDAAPGMIPLLQQLELAGAKGVLNPLPAVSAVSTVGLLKERARSV